MNRALSRLPWLWIVIAGGMGLTASCIEPLDLTRAVKPERSLGAIVYEDICQRVAHGDDPSDVTGARSRKVCRDGAEPVQVEATRLGALHEERQRLIDAVDHALEAPLAEDLDVFLKKVLPLFEDVNLKAQTEALSELLGKVESSPEALAALTRLATREGYRPMQLRPGVISPLFKFKVNSFPFCLNIPFINSPFNFPL